MEIKKLIDMLTEYKELKTSRKKELLLLEIHEMIQKERKSLSKKLENYKYCDKCGKYYLNTSVKTKAERKILHNVLLHPAYSFYDWDDNKYGDKEFIIITGYCPKCNNILTVSKEEVV